jgi:hypothetical protein
MTVQTTTSTQSFLGDGVTQAFPFSFKFEDVSHVLARYVLAGPTYQQLAPLVDYTVIAAAGNVGGTVTTSVPVPLGITLQIYRIVPFLQLLDYVANDQFPAEASETALDLIVEGMQQLRDALTGATAGTFGGITTIINEGGLGAVGLFNSIVANTANFFSLEAGANITLTNTGQTIRIDGAAGGATVGALLAANNLSDVASLQQSIDNITQATMAPNEYVWTKDTASGQGKWKVVPTGGAGEANTMSSLGGVASLVGTKVGVNLPVRGLTAGANITLTQRATDILVDASASGEANVGQNVGVTGQGWYAGKLGLALQFRGHAPGPGIKVASNTTDLTTSIDVAASLTWTGRHDFIGPYADPGYPAVVANAGSFDDNFLRVARTTPIGNNTLLQASAFIGTYVSANTVTAGENSLFVSMDDYSAAGNQNTGVYHAVRRNADSHIWGAVFDVSDAAHHTSNVGNMYGMEISILSDNTSLAARRVLIGAFYGARSPSTASKHTGGFLIRPFDALAQLGYGVSIETGKVDQSFLSSAIGLSAFAATGNYSTAAIDLSGITTTPIAVQINGGSVLRFFSGNAGNSGGVATWYPGAFVPAYSGALRIYVDNSVLYIPICSNHP